MLNTVIWALGTGFITGGVWIAVVILQAQHRLRKFQVDMSEETELRLDHLETLEGRLAEVEDRLAFTERLLAERAEPARLDPPADRDASDP